jgi:hypothetical protein
MFSFMIVFDVDPRHFNEKAHRCNFFSCTCSQCAEALGESGQQLTAVYVSLSQTYKDNEQYDLALEFFHKELELWENNPMEVRL